MRIVVLISGSGSNLQAIIDACANEQIAGNVVGVISNVPGVAGLERARRAGIETLTVDHRQFPSRTAFDQKLGTEIDRFKPDLIVLAGFMRILSAELIERFHGKMLNIHPSLLPAFPGLNTHQRALEAGHQRHGASVHFVTAELDGGPLIIQAEVPVLSGDDPPTLAARVLKEEHRILPLAINWIAAGRLRMGKESAELDGEPIHDPLGLKHHEA